MEIEYFFKKTIMASIEVEDIGNTAIVANNDSGEMYAIIVKTDFGTSSILTFGPFSETCIAPPEKAFCKFEKINWSLHKVESTISKFLNNPSFCITQAIEVDISDALEMCPDICSYMR